jgi:uncharacterized membrane protein YidH (DUF202 family)
MYRKLLQRNGYVSLLVGLSVVFGRLTASAQAAAGAAPNGWLQFLLPALILLVIAFGLGKLFAKFLPDGQRRITVGAVVAVIGAGLAIYGLAYLNSTSSQIASQLGSPGNKELPIALLVGVVATGGGILFAVAGFVMMTSRAQPSTK